MFLDEIQRQQHLDVEYIFQKLRDTKAFHFVAAVKQVRYTPVWDYQLVCVKKDDGFGVIINDVHILVTQ